MKRRIVWFAASGDVARMGPFKSEVDAWAHIRLTAEAMERNGSRRPFSDDAIVWCEEESR